MIMVGVVEMVGGLASAGSYRDREKQGLYALIPRLLSFVLAQLLAMNFITTESLGS
jgi:hypothetical protein